MESYKASMVVFFHGQQSVMRGLDGASLSFGEEADVHEAKRAEYEV